MAMGLYYFRVNINFSNKTHCKDGLYIAEWIRRDSLLTNTETMKQLFRFINN